MSPIPPSAPLGAEPAAADYIEHAKEINRIAGSLLQLDLSADARTVNWLTGKISLGLSLQAGELAGKAMLKSLGIPTDNIRREHNRHNLVALLWDVQTKASERNEAAFAPFRNFLCSTITIDGQLFGSTIGAYLTEHFSQGVSARPRSYFYPDESVFTGPIPFQTLFTVVNELIKVAERLDALVVRSE
jgi:hypothetical protein